MFRGYRLASVATGIFPERLIAWESMQMQPEQVAELQAYEDNNNDLVRKTALHKRFKMSFQTLNLTNTELKEINDWLDGAITNQQEQRIPIIAWNDRKQRYDRYECYLPNMTYQERSHHGSVINYKPVTFTFISYSQGIEITDQELVSLETSWM